MSLLSRNHQNTWPVLILSSISDITDRKQIEEKLAQYSENLEEMVEKRTSELLIAQEKLARQEQLATLGQMAGNIGHELRNPLSAISGAIYILKMILPDTDEKIKQSLDIIEDQIRVSEKIINDLLSFARNKSVELERVSASELVQKTLERFPAPPLIDVMIDIPDNLPPIFVDPSQIIQVLGNIIVNAFQAMPNGGQLTLSSEIENDMISIKVRDSGEGIPPENMKKIFEPLFTTKVKGIGLGLPVCQKLIEANEGHIEVQSEVNKRTVFTVYIPIYKETVSSNNDQK